MGQSYTVDFSDPWVQAALRGQLDRAAFARHLRTIGDPRAELVELTDRLVATDVDEPAARARIGVLRAAVDERWWKLFAPAGWILGCRGAERNGLLQMAVECDRSWAEMAPTPDPQVRRCEGCREQVHRVTTRAEAAAGDAARGIAAATEHAMVTGRPHAPTYWARSVLGS